MKVNENGQAENPLSVLEKEIELLMELNQKIHPHMIMDDFVNEVLFLMKDKSHFEGANIILLQKNKAVMTTYALDLRLYDDPERYQRVRDRLGLELPVNVSRWMDRCALEKKEIYFPVFDSGVLQTLSPEERDTVLFLGYSGCLLMPLFIQEEALGTLLLYNVYSPLFLSESQTASLRRLASLISRALENARIYHQLKFQKKVIETQNRLLRQEIRLAGEIQEKMIPSTSPDLHGAALSFFYQPMEGLGGDFFDFIKVREPELTGIFISDVSGHGVPAALITGMVKALLETSGASKLNPELLMEYLNRNVFGRMAQNFITAFYGIYNSEKKCLTFCRAGHPFPLLIRDSQIQELHSTGKALGIFDSLSWQEITVFLQEGDRLIFYTDGLMEAENSDGEFFEPELMKILLETTSLSTSETIQEIRSRLIEFAGHFKFQDDVCFIVMDIL